MKERVYLNFERIGELEILEHLTAGSCAAIYRARHSTGGECALKIGKFDMAALPAAVRLELSARLYREYVALSALDHPGVVKVHESGWYEGTAYYTMEMLGGLPLAPYLAQKRRRYWELMQVFLHLAEALAHCHERGIVHRDIKPSNIIVEPERGPVLIDFGICQPLVLNPYQPLTAPGAVLGTFEYLSPEYAAYLLSPYRPGQLFRGEASADVFALGVLLYELLTGRRPTRTLPEKLIPYLTEVRDQVPPHPRELHPEAPQACSELAMLLLSKSLRERPGDAQKLPELVRAAINRDAPAMFRCAPEYCPGSESPAQAPELAEGPDARGAAGEEGRDARGFRKSGARYRRVRRWPARLNPHVLTCSAVLALLLAFGWQLLRLADVSVQLLHTSPVRASQGAQSVPSADDASLGTATGLPVLPLVKGGLKMPLRPKPNWMRPPCVAPDGGRMGAIPLRGACWYVTINPTYIDVDGKPQKREPCAEPSYDPPPEDPRKHYCLDPVKLERPPPSPSPFPQAVDSKSGARKVGPDKGSSTGR